MILDLWKRSRPNEYRGFMELVQQEYQNLVHANGMSRDGQFAYKGMIPTTVYCVVSHYVPGYLQKPENLIKIHRMVMGQFAPKADKNFHVIDRRTPNVPSPDEVRS